MTALPVFVAEFDDDYQRAASLSREDLRSRVRCYHLLAPSLVLHPAYVWQSRSTHALVTAEMAKIMAPPFTRAALGDSPNFAEYLNQRMGTLETGQGKAGPNTELMQYQRWGNLANQVAGLDARFESEPGIAFAKSRDRMFRDLLRRDLISSVVAGTTLGEQIRGWALVAIGAGACDRIVRSLQGFVSGARLVSLDSIVAFLSKIGAEQLVRSPKFYNRMLVLYYRANVDDNFVVAGLPTLDPNDPTIHPYDPKLFWSIVGHVFGSEVEATLSGDTSATVEDLLIRLKTDSDWQMFVTQYVQLRENINSTLSDEADNLAVELELSRDYLRLKVLPRVWREQKTELITSILGLGFSAVGVVTPGIIAIGGLITGAISGVLTLKPIRRFADEYQQNYLTSLKKKVRREMRLLVRI